MPLKFPPQPQEWKIVSLRECPTPADIQLCETPEQAAAYWKMHITTHPYFNPECECLVVLILNTRRKIKGHYFVSIGTMDTILVHPREVFRLAIMASASYGADGAHPHVTPRSRMDVRGFAGVADYGVADEMGKITLETRRQPLLRTKEPEKH